MERLNVIRRFLLLKTAFDLNFICHEKDSANPWIRKLIDLAYDRTRDGPSIHVPKKSTTHGLKREAKEVVFATLSAPKKRFAKNVLSRFFYYHDATIRYVSDKKKRSGGVDVFSSTVAGRNKGEGTEGNKDDDEEGGEGMEEEPWTREKRRAETEADDERPFKRIRVEGYEEKFLSKEDEESTVEVISEEEEEESETAEMVRITETIDANLVELVERVPEDVWWLIFYRLVSDLAFPSHMAFLNSPFLKYALGVNATWARLVSRVIYEKRPSLIYSDPKIAAIVDANVRGGIVVLDLVSHHKLAERAGWYSHAKKRPVPIDDPKRKQGRFVSVLENELGRPITTTTTTEEDVTGDRGAWFKNLRELKFKQQSFEPSPGGDWKWEMENDFLKRMTNLTILQIDQITKPLEPDVTERLVRLTTLSLRGLIYKSQFRNSKVPPSDPDLYNTAEDEALHKLPSLTDLKLEDVQGVTMKGVLMLTNLTSLYHDGEFSAFPLKKKDHVHEPYFRHMTQLRRLNLQYSWLAKWKDDVYDPMEDLINLPDLKDLTLNDFRKLTMDRLPSSLEKLNVSYGKGDFYFSKNDAGEERTLPHLKKLNVKGLVSYAASPESKRFARICPNLVSLKMNNELDFRSIDERIKSQMTRLTYEPGWVHFFPIPSFENLASEFPNLVRLEISSVGFPHDKCLSRLTSLRRLSVNGRITSATLEGTNVTDEELHEFLEEDLERSFRSLTGLTRLDLRNVPQFNPPLDFAGMRELTNLTHLTMDRSPAKNKDVAPLWDRLTTLKLSACPNIGNKRTTDGEFTGENLKSVNMLTNLTSLHVQNDEEEGSEYWVDEECADFLPALKRLKIDEQVLLGLFPEE